jgi:hypothetical protein
MIILLWLINSVTTTAAVSDVVLHFTTASMLVRLQRGGLAIYVPFFNDVTFTSDSELYKFHNTVVQIVGGF